MASLSAWPLCPFSSCLPHTTSAQDMGRGTGFLQTRCFLGREQACQAIEMRVAGSGHVHTSGRFTGGEIQLFGQQFLHALSILSSDEA